MPAKGTQRIVLEHLLEVSTKNRGDMESLISHPTVSLMNKPTFTCGSSWHQLRVSSAVQDWIGNYSANRM